MWIVLLMLRTLGSRMMNLLFLQWVIMLAVCILVWTWSVTLCRMLLLTRRLRELPIGPSRLRLTNRMVRSDFASAVWLRRHLVCEMSLWWPSSLANELQRVRRCSLCCRLCVVATLVNTDIKAVGAALALGTRVTERLIYICALLSWTIWRLWDRDCRGLVCRLVCTCRLSELLGLLRTLFMLWVSSYLWLWLSRRYRVEPIRRKEWLRLMTVTFIGEDLTVV